MCVDKKSTLFCGCLPLSQAINFAFVLQLIAVVCTVAFFPWRFSIVPATAAFFTGLGCYFPGSKWLRCFILYFDMMRVFVSFFGAIALAIYIGMTDFCENECKNYGTINPITRTIKYDEQTFQTIEECADLVSMWYLMGFIYFFLVSVPAILIALEIIYYWKKDLSEKEQDEQETITPGSFDR